MKTFPQLFRSADGILPRENRITGIIILDLDDLTRLADNVTPMEQFKSAA
ncbi:MAG: hypothetical protein R3D51_16045 [Hyphomicrobiaceae bacterium]